MKYKGEEEGVDNNKGKKRRRNLKFCEKFSSHTWRRIFLTRRHGWGKSVICKLWPALSREKNPLDRNPVGSGTVLDRVMKRKIPNAGDEIRNPAIQFVASEIRRKILLKKSLWLNLIPPPPPK
jgi:hypothetical protein